SAAWAPKDSAPTAAARTVAARRLVLFMGGVPVFCESYPRTWGQHPQNKATKLSLIVPSARLGRHHAAQEGKYHACQSTKDVESRVLELRLAPVGQPLRNFRGNTQRGDQRHTEPVA